MIQEGYTQNTQLMQNQEVSKTDAPGNPGNQSQEGEQKKRPARTQEAQDKILENLAAQTRPNFTAACIKAGVNRSWAYEMREIDREFDMKVNAAVNRIREEIIDQVEEKFLNRVLDTDQKLSQDERWILETIGKRRGYVKRIETVPLGLAGFSPTDLDNMNGEEAANAYSTMLNARGTVN